MIYAFLKNGYNRASLVMLVILVLVGLNTVWDYGMSWDEPYRYRGGQEKLDYYSAIFKGDSLPNALERDNLKMYPGLFDLTLAFVAWLSPFDLFFTGHLWSFAFGVLGIIGCWRIGYLLGGERCAFFSMLLVGIMPRYYGHMYINPKDIPFAAMYVWVIYYMLRVIRELPKISTKLMVKVGLVLGLCMGVRIGGLVTFCYLGLSVLIFALVKKLAVRDWIGLGIRLFGVLLIGYIALLPWWPFGHQNPINATLQTLSQAEKFPWNAPVLFNGQFVFSADIPFYYSLVWLFLSTPEIVIVLLFSGLFFIFRDQNSNLIFRLQLFLVSLAFIFPFVYVMIRNSVLYDGIRHLLFALPPLACLAGLSLNAWFSYFEKKWRSYVLILWGGLFFGLSMPLVKLFDLHPYQYTYFNALSGGLAYASGRYETEYWGTAYREAVDVLKVSLEEDRSYNVTVGQPYYSALCFFPKNFKYTPKEAEADFSICTTRLNLHEAFEGDPYLVIARDGVPFVVVKDRRGMVGETNKSVP